MIDRSDCRVLIILIAKGDYNVLIGILIPFCLVRSVHIKYVYDGIL